MCDGSKELTAVFTRLILPGIINIYIIMHIHMHIQ